METDDAYYDAQAKIAANAMAHKNARTASNALLIGRIYDDAGNRMSPTTSHKGAIRYRFYISTAHTFGSKKTAGSIARVSAEPIETAITNVFRQRLARIAATEHESSATHPVQLDDRQLIEAHVERVTVSKESLAIVIKPPAKLENAEENDDSAMASSETIVIPFRAKNRRPRRDILRQLGNEADEASGVRADTRQLLLRGIAKARTWARELAEGKVESIEAIATREENTPRYIRLMLPLAFLAPDIVMAVMANTIPVDLGVSRLTDGYHIPGSSSEKNSTAKTGSNSHGF